MSAQSTAPPNPYVGSQAPAAGLVGFSSCEFGLVWRVGDLRDASSSGGSWLGFPRLLLLSVHAPLLWQQQQYDQCDRWKRKSEPDRHLRRPNLGRRTKDGSWCSG